MDKKGILDTLITHYTGGNKSQFAKLLGIKPQTINTWDTRGTFDLELIYSKCEGISGDWLLTGEGPMLKESPQGFPGAPPKVPEASSPPSSRAMKPQKTAGGNTDDTTAFLACIKEQTALLNEAIKAKDTVIEQKNQEIRTLDRRVAQLECDNRHLADEVARLTSEASPKNAPAHS